MKDCKCIDCGVELIGVHYSTLRCSNCRKQRLIEQRKKFGTLNYNKKQSLKKENHKCIKCGNIIIGKQLSAKYCDSCKKQKTLELKKESYKRNLLTVKKYNILNKDIINEKNRIREAKMRDSLSDRYVKKLFREKHGLSTDQITRDLIETKLIIIKTKRLCKTLKN